MGRTATPYLFDLIHSLSKSEKRYFRLHSKSHRPSANYTILFEAMLRMKEYDETELSDILKESGMHKDLSFRKKHLYVLILNSLENFHKSSKSEMKILSLLSQVEITYNKGLYEQSELLIEKGIVLAKKHFKFGYELILIHRKRDLLNHLQNTKLRSEMTVDFAAELLEELDLNESRLNELVKINYEASKIYTKSTLIVRFGSFEEIENVVEEIEKFKDANSLEDLPFNVQIKIRRAEDIVLFAKKDLEGQKEVLMNSIALFEANPVMMSEHAQEYMLHLNNILVAKIHSFDYEECEVYLNQLNDLTDDSNKLLSKTERIRAFAFWQYNKLKLLNTQGKFEEVELNFNENKFSQIKISLNAYKRTQILLERCIGLTFTQDYRAVIKIVTEALSESEVLQKEVLSQMRVVYYVAHKMRNNDDVLQQYSKSNDSQIIQWYQAHPQEYRFLSHLLSPSGIIDEKTFQKFINSYPVKVNPHFTFYLSKWFENYSKTTLEI